MDCVRGRLSSRPLCFARSNNPGRHADDACHPIAKLRIHEIRDASDIAYRRVVLLHFTVTQKPCSAAPALRYSRSDRNHQGKRTYSAFPGPRRLIIAVPDRCLAIVIDTAQNLTITDTGGKRATVTERADDGAPACSKGEAPCALSDETAYSTDLT